MEPYEIYPERLWLLPEHLQPEEQIALIIPDTHLCYELEDALEFLVSVAVEKKCTRILHVGDLIDSATVNMHAFDPDGLSPTTELEKTKAHIRRWAEIFPEMKIAVGNHFTAATRLGKKHGIPKIYLKTVQQLFEYPNGWDVQERHVFKDVVIEHGQRFGGASGAISTAKNNLKSTCIGHLHQQMSITYFNNGEKQLFGMSVGTLVDDNNIAFAYAKHAKHRSALGCGIVYSDSHAEIVPYSKSKDYGTIKTAPVVIKQVKVVDPVVKEVKPFTINSRKKKKKVKKGVQGNVQGTKHSGHAKAGDKLHIKFPNGDIMSFMSVEACKEEIRSRIPKRKNSTLTNISKAARSNGSAYGCSFSYDDKRAKHWKENE